MYTHWLGRHTQRRRGMRSLLLLVAFAAYVAPLAAAIPASERTVLTTLFNQTGGPAWTNKSGWGGTAGTECTWQGIQCDAAQAHVISINFGYVDGSGNFIGNNLAGTLPALNALTSLQFLSIPANSQLTGSIPSLTGLTSLQSVYLFNNQLTGSIPSLSGLSSLQHFVVINNKLTGSIPSLSGLAALQEFEAYNNQLTGSIPNLSGLSALRIFNAPFNQLTGSIPSLSGLAALTEFSINDNRISGAIPPLTGLTALQYFIAYDNQLTGSIPALGGLTGLQNFLVANNQLTGNIPALTGLTNLVSFDVGTNQLSGPIPSLTGLTNLQGFYARLNQLTGPVPALTGLTKLQSVSLRFNRLTGTLPQLSGLSSLQYFNVQGNGFTGDPPAPPASLLAGQSTLCDNALNRIASPAWDTATGQTPWYSTCTSCPSSLDITFQDTPVGTGTDTVITGTVTTTCKAATTGSGTITIADDKGKLICYITLTNNTGSCHVVLPGGTTTNLTAGFSGATNVAPASKTVPKTTPVSTPGNLDQYGWTGAWGTGVNAQGILFEIYPDLFGVGSGAIGGGWFTYDSVAGSEDKKRWYSLQGAVSNSSASTTLDIYNSVGGNFNAVPVVKADHVGYANLSFTDCTHGSLSFSFIDGRTGNIPLSRLDPNITCDPTKSGNGASPGKFLLSGAWSTASSSGQGILFNINPALNNTFAAWYTYAPNGQVIGGPASQRWYTLQIANANVGASPVNNIGIFSAQGGVFNANSSVTTPQVGSASIAFNNCNTLVLNYSFTAGTNAGQSGTLVLNRSVAVPSGCSL